MKNSIMDKSSPINYGFDVTKIGDYEILSFVVENSADKPQKAILFGYEKFKDADNFGSDKGIAIKSKSKHIPYNEALYNTNVTYVKKNIEFVRIKADNQKQIQESLVYINRDRVSFDMELTKYPHSESMKMIDVNCMLSFDNESYFWLMIPPKSRTKIAFCSKIKREYYMEKSPYQVCIKNENKKISNASILGRNYNMLKENFGSDKGIKIQASQDGVTYPHLLFESGEIDLDLDLIRIQCANKKQFELPFYLVEKTANGDNSSKLIDVEEYFWVTQLQEGIVDIALKNKMHANSGFEYEILPDTEVIFTIFTK